MMQPTDLRSTSFGKGLFGYKKADVDQYVDTVYRAYDEIFTERNKLGEEVERLKKSLEDTRVEMFELEKKLQAANAPKAEAPKTEAPKAEAPKAEAPKPEVKVEPIPDDMIKKPEPAPEAPKAEAPKTESASSKFFNNDDDMFGSGDDDDVFVGEIEDGRKPAKVMIGDGEDSGSDDFEFI